MLLLSARGAKARPIARSQRSVDLDALANMLITETGFRRDKREMAQIVYVAINRARKYDAPISRVVAPGRPSGVIAWNASSNYRRRFNAAKSNPRWEAAREFAADILDGSSSYRNAGYTSFVHPGGMPTPPCAENRVAKATFAGTRCLPKWVATGDRVGGAMFA